MKSLIDMNIKYNDMQKELLNYQIDVQKYTYQEDWLHSLNKSTNNTTIKP